MDYIQRTVDNYNLVSSNSEMQSIQIRCSYEFFHYFLSEGSCRKDTIVVLLINELSD